jgi:CBS domain-containing protein
MRLRELNPRQVVTITRSDSLRDAAKHLVDDDIGVLVVFEPRGLVGIFSERDLARAVADGVDMEYAEVGEYMTSAPVVSDVDSPVGDVIAKMNIHGIRHVVVVENDGKDVMGVVSMRDVIRLLGSVWPEL